VKILVTGGDGQMAKDVVWAARAAGYDVEAVSRQRLDITDESRVIAALSSWRPELIVNCAAWTAVDACEDDPERAHLVNATGVSNIMRGARTGNSHVVHISTDYVFDGTKDGPYLETDDTNPQSVYGQSKLAGEKIAADAGATVVRTSWVCGYGGNNMVKTILRLAKEHDQLTFVDDQRGHPSFTADLAPRLLDLGLARQGGIFHLTNQGPVSWFEFAREVMAAAGHDPDRVSPIATADLQPQRPAPRPTNSVLANEAIVAAGFGPVLRDFREPLAELVNQLTTVD